MYMYCKNSKIINYEGEITWDSAKPDGTPRKLLDVSKSNELGLKRRMERDRSNARREINLIEQQLINNYSIQQTKKEQK